MVPVRGITVCWGYDDLLSITLPRNMRHFTECLVVTSPEDKRTQKVAADVGARIHITDALTRHGAVFNKGLALEEAFDSLGREGWLCVWDSDVILPYSLGERPVLNPTCLYSASRRILSNPKQWTPDFDWRTASPSTDRAGLLPGYFHLFHASDPALLPQPWYDVTYAHAGGSDGFFQSRWPRACKIRLPFEVLHLGPIDRNWYGRVTERLDGEAIYFSSEGMRGLRERWKSQSRLPPHERYGDRVKVPGNEARPWIHTN